MVSARLAKALLAARRIVWWQQPAAMDSVKSRRAMVNALRIVAMRATVATGSVRQARMVPTVPQIASSISVATTFANPPKTVSSVPRIAVLADSFAVMGSARKAKRRRFVQRIVGRSPGTVATAIVR